MIRSMHENNDEDQTFIVSEGNLCKLSGMLSVEERK
jgi:hypothetical protein